MEMSLSVAEEQEFARLLDSPPTIVLPGRGPVSHAHNMAAQDIDRNMRARNMSYTHINTYSRYVYPEVGDGSMKCVPSFSYKPTGVPRTQLAHDGPMSMKAALSGRPVRLERGKVGGWELVSDLWQVRKWMIKGSGDDDWEPWNINSRDIMVVDEVEGCLSSECRLGRFGSEASILISRGHYEEASFPEMDNISSPDPPLPPLSMVACRT